MSSYTACALTHQIASFEKIAMGRTIDSRVHIKQELCYFVPKFLSMENVGDGLAALSKSAVEPIWLGRWLE